MPVMVLGEPDSPSVSGLSVESEPLALFLDSSSPSSSSFFESELSSLSESSLASLLSPLGSTFEVLGLSEPSPELAFLEVVSLVKSLDSPFLSDFSIVTLLDLSVLEDLSFESPAFLAESFPESDSSLLVSFFSVEEESSFEDFLASDSVDFFLLGDESVAGFFVSTSPSPSPPSASSSVLAVVVFLAPELEASESVLGTAVLEVGGSVFGVYLVLLLVSF